MWPKAKLGTAIGHYDGEPKRFSKELIVRKERTAELDIYNKKSDTSIAYINLAVDWESKFLSGRHYLFDDSDLSPKPFQGI